MPFPRILGKVFPGFNSYSMVWRSREMLSKAWLVLLGGLGGVRFMYQGGFFLYEDNRIYEGRSLTIMRGPDVMIVR